MNSLNGGEGISSVVRGGLSRESETALEPAGHGESPPRFWVKRKAALSSTTHNKAASTRKRVRDPCGNHTSLPVNETKNKCILLYKISIEIKNWHLEKKR